MNKPLKIRLKIQLQNRIMLDIKCPLNFLVFNNRTKTFPLISSQTFKRHPYEHLFFYLASLFESFLQQKFFIIFTVKIYILLVGYGRINSHRNFF